MTSVEKKQFAKFKTMVDWVLNDIKNTMFCARANFLVAQSLFNYTELFGSFRIGQFKKDKAGNIKKNRKGRPIETSCSDRFNEYFSYMGKEYDKLLNIRMLNVYSEIRCGLTHEYLVKKKKFCIYNPAFIIDELWMDKIKHPKNPNKIVNCGVIHYRNAWHIINPKYYIDFKRSLIRFIEEIDLCKDHQINQNFFERAGFINLQNFL